MVPRMINGTRNREDKGRAFYRGSGQEHQVSLVGGVRGKQT